MIPKDKSGCLYIKDPKNREYLSFLEYVGEGKDIFSNMRILSRKQYLEKWLKDNNLDNNVVFAVADSSYSNNKIHLSC